MDTISDTITTVEAGQDEAIVQPEPDTGTQHEVEPDPGDDDPDTAGSASARPVLVFVNLSTVTVEVNVRKAPKVSREFVASVKRHGVLVPMLGYLDAEGEPVIRDGQRRIIAAQKAGVTEAPAIIYPNRDAMLTTDEAERARIIEQMNANAHREGLTEADEADGILRLTLTGMEATVVAKELVVKPARVTAALAVASSDFARKVIEKRQITLDQAAVVAEFEDSEDDVRTLLHIAENDADHFAHEAQRLRDKRERERAFQAELDEYAAKGVPLVEAPPRYDNRTADAYLHELQNEHGEPVTVENYEGKPGYAIAVVNNYGSPKIGHVVTEWRSHGLRRITHGGAVQGKLTEAEKADRREVVANNKEWDSAETVRRDWLTTLLSRKTQPKDVEQFVAYTATERPFAFGKSLDNGMAATLLGIEPKYGALAKFVAANPAEARLVLFALAVAAGELALHRGSWRRPDAHDRAFLNWLTSWGYTTSRVENIIASPAKPKATRSRRAKAAEPTAGALTEASAEVEATAPTESDAEPEVDATVEPVEQDVAEVDTPATEADDEAEVEADEEFDADAA
jgi:ParB family chromosome partitioning protein